MMIIMIVTLTIMQTVIKTFEELPILCTLYLYLDVISLRVNCYTVVKFESMIKNKEKKNSVRIQFCLTMTNDVSP